jgi:branched-chain amino acid transport system permease protein
VGTYAVTVLDGIAFGLLLFTVAAGLALVFGVMDTLNLAHGTLYLAGAYLAAQISQGSMLALLAAVAAGIGVGACAGTVLAGLLRPLAGQHLNQALASLGIAFLAADGFITAFGAAPLPANPPRVLAGSLTIAGHGYPTYRLTFIVVAACIAVGLHLVVRHSAPGRMLRATVADADMAAATGIPTRRVHTIALACGGALATGAGVLGAPLMGPAPGVDTTILVLSLVVVVIGGTGSIPLTLLAALGVGQVQTLGVLVAPATTSFALFGVLLVVLVARPRPETAVALP